jgi:hypothetical protein
MLMCCMWYAAAAQVLPGQWSVAAAKGLSLKRGRALSWLQAWRLEAVTILQAAADATGCR